MPHERYEIFRLPKVDGNKNQNSSFVSYQCIPISYFRFLEKLTYVVKKKYLQFTLILAKQETRTKSCRPRRRSTHGNSQLEKYPHTYPAKQPTFKCTWLPKS